MNKYNIEISYHTGDSFSNEDTTGLIEGNWEDLDIAKKNLQYIKEHYELYKLCNERWDKKKSNQDLYKEYKDKPWFVLKEKLANIQDLSKDLYQVVDRGGNGTIIDSFYANHCIKLELDNNKEWQFNCFWCGYFETLYGAKIIPLPDNELEFTI